MRTVVLRRYLRRRARGVLRHRAVIAGTLLAFVLAPVILWGLRGLGSLLASPPPLEQRPASPPPAVSSPGIEETVRSSTAVVRPGSNVFSLLVRAGIDPGEVLRLVESLAHASDLRKCRPGEVFTINHRADGSVASVVYRKGPLEVYQAQRRPDAWQVIRQDVPVETRTVRLAGRVTSSLFGAMDAMGASDALAVALIDILSWEIDFAHETKPGDSFALVVEKQYVNDREVGPGKILAAHYASATGRVVQAFSLPEEKRTGYYTERGESLRKSFLRTPLRFTRISSGFTSRRLHPVTGVVQPHYAIDYAAPSGTPVWSVSDGTVRSVSFNNASGRMVSISHPGGYETLYLHLSGYAKGIRSGVRVRQQQTIGYVGSTGLATGPHLDFRMRKNGSYVNPLREEFPRAEPVPAAAREAFDRRVAWLLPLLNGDAGSTAVSSTR